jgi:hypothetical protein
MHFVITVLCYNCVHAQIKDEIDELHREAREGWCDFDKVTRHSQFTKLLCITRNSKRQTCSSTCWSEHCYVNLL